jgi:hypothetical protein
VIVRRAEELSVEEVVGRREMVVAVADGEITAAALLADWLVAKPGATIDCTSAEVLGALVWRIGQAALRFYALVDGVQLADALVPPGVDSVEWTRGWLAGRSSVALDAAAALIRGRGGDDLERAEFARLFAIGEPQEGMAAWLESRSTRRSGT